MEKKPNPTGVIFVAIAIFVLLNMVIVGVVLYIHHS